MRKLARSLSIIKPITFDSDIRNDIANAKCITGKNYSLNIV